MQIDGGPIRYIVVRGSDEGELQEGDRITILPDGSIMLNYIKSDRPPIGGWLNPERAAKVLESAELVPDRELAEEYIKKLEREILAVKRAYLL